MKIQVGYVPLTDAAPVIAAAERGFARDEGLEIALSREPSWATLRDRLALGHLDAAHMLAPLAIASTLGLSGPQADLVVPMGLSLNGNALTLSTPLWAEMGAPGGATAEVAAAFARVAGERAQAGRPLTLGTVHPFSCHTYQIRLFARLGGLDPQGLRLVVVPPPETVDAMATGSIDGFCCGAPWNSIAVEAGLGRIAALGCEIVPDCPEKVLALPTRAAGYGAPLVRALRRAGSWCADPAHREELAGLLCERAGLGAPANLIARTLSGEMMLDAAGTARTDPFYLRLDAGAHAPRPEQAAWLMEQMASAGQLAPNAALAARAGAIYRPDLFAAL